MENIEIVIGTYENHLLGYTIDSTLNGGYTLNSSFTDDSHCGAIRCVAVSHNGILASSSTDDSIRIHSLKSRKDIGGLFQHEGSVNSIQFFKGSHMLSAGEDNTICLWKARKWELLRILKGHKAHVMAVAIHPSGKLGFSVGKDRSFFTWDLTTGKLAFRRKVADVAQDVRFTKDGSHYVLVYNKKLEICSMENTDVVQEINVDFRINSVCFVEPDVIAIGGDDRYVHVINIFDGQQILKVDAANEGFEFTGRVRALSVLESDKSKLLFIGMSDGSIKICTLNIKESGSQSEVVLYYEANVRLTCMTVYLSVNTVDEKETEASTVSSKMSKNRKDLVAKPVDNASSHSSDDDDKSDEIEDDSLADASKQQALPKVVTAKKRERKRQKKKRTPDSHTGGKDACPEKKVVVGNKRKRKSPNQKAVKRKKQEV